MITRSATHHIFDDFILAILSLDFEKVIAEVKEVKAPLLSQQHDDGTAGPVQPIPKALPGRTRNVSYIMFPLESGPSLSKQTRKVSLYFSIHYF